MTAERIYVTNIRTHIGDPAIPRVCDGDGDPYYAIDGAPGYDGLFFGTFNERAALQPLASDHPDARTFMGATQNWYAVMRRAALRNDRCADALDALNAVGHLRMVTRNA